MIALLKSFEIYLSYNNDNNNNTDDNDDTTKSSYNFVNLMKESNLIQSSVDNENSDINVNYYKLAPLNVEYYLLNGIILYIYNL